MAKQVEQGKFDKLPKWAQERMRDLEGERQAAVRQLNEFVDSQTESRLWVDEMPCTGEERGPSYKKHFIQSRKVTFLVGKTEVYVSLAIDNPGELNINCGSRQMVFQPNASNSITIIDK